jgi:hydroxyacylglutathione hydrolase
MSNSDTPADSLKIFSYTVGPFAENTYLLIRGSDALIIDPGFENESEFKAMQEQLEESGASLIAVLLTHAHVDHVLGLNRVLRSYKVPVYLSHEDLFIWKNASAQAAMFGIQMPGFSFTPEPLTEQKGFSIGPFQMDLLYTPGHSPDHISIYFPDDGKLIAGDALFRESIGRTDLYKGDFDQLADSIRNKIYTLPDDTEVLPGHMGRTLVGYERAHNPYVRDLS